MTDRTIYEEVKDTARDVLYQLRMGNMESQEALVELAALQVAMLADVAEYLSILETRVRKIEQKEQV
jgi:hypothetical protein